MPDSRTFQIAEIPIHVESDIPMSDSTFCAELAAFETRRPRGDPIHIEHHFGLPDVDPGKLGQKVFERESFSAYRSPGEWVYFIHDYDMKSNRLHQVVFVNPPHTRIKIYHDREDLFKEGGLPFLAFYPTDQLILSRVLADRRGCMFHASGVDLNGTGMLFAGHSGAGKSTMVKMLQGHADILCDDRIIVRKGPDGFRIYGTWHHGEVPVFSARSAPLRTIFFLEKASRNRFVPISDKTELVSRLLGCAIKAVKPLTTADWWTKTLILIHDLVQEIPCRTLEFNKSGEVVGLLRET